MILFTRYDYRREQTGLLCLNTAIKFYKNLPRKIEWNCNLADLMMMSSNPAACCLNLNLPFYQKNECGKTFGSEPPSN